MVFVYVSVTVNLFQSQVCQSILAEYIVWMVSTRPTISNSFSPFTKTLVTVTSAPITVGITVTFMFHIPFSTLVRYFLKILLCGLLGQQISQFDKFLLVFLLVWSSDRD